jgi:hypothetical protein
VHSLAACAKAASENRNAPQNANTTPAIIFFIELPFDQKW